VTTDAFGDRDLLLGYYEKQADEFRLRHAAIWEEIRHYTWLLSLLLAWPVALLSAKDLSQLWRYAPYFVFLPVLGLCFSAIAFFVIRREYRFYTNRTPSFCMSRRC
jgi:steroid 5-alpha reductase family enzyme